MRKKPYTPRWLESRAARRTRRAADPRIQSRVEAHDRRREEFHRQELLAKAENDKAVRAAKRKAKKEAAA